jgi:hypothetical protein
MELVFKKEKKKKKEHQMMGIMEKSGAVEEQERRRICSVRAVDFVGKRKGKNTPGHSKQLLKKKKNTTAPL